MTDQTRFDAKLNKLNGSLKSKLRLGGRLDATTNLRRARHRLPWHLRKEADKILRVEEAMAHPKLARLANTGSLDGSFKAMSTHLKNIDLDDQRKGARIGLAASVMFNLIVVAVLLTVAVIFFVN